MFRRKIKEKTKTSAQTGKITEQDVATNAQDSSSKSGMTRFEKEQLRALKMPMYIGVVIVSVYLVLNIIFAFWGMVNVSKTELVLDTVVALIGLAIATWTGLNIVSTIERKEVGVLQVQQDKLATSQDQISKRLTDINDDLSPLQDTLSSLDEKQKELATSQDQISGKITAINSGLSPLQNSLIYELVVALSQSGDEQHLRYAEKFKDAANSLIESALFESIGILLQAELLFNRVYSLHERGISRRIRDEDAARGIAFLDSFISQDVRNALVKEFAEFLRADFFFYQAYAKTDQKTKIEKFRIAIEEYEKILCAKIGKSLSDVTDCGNIDFASENDKQEAAYFFNSIGNGYSEAVWLNWNLIKKQDWALTNEEVVDYIEKAERFCEISVRLHRRSVYSKNYGLSIERRKDPPDNEDLKKALVHYEDALKLDFDARNNYHVVISTNEKQIKEKLGIGYKTPGKPRNPSIKKLAEKLKDQSDSEIEELKSQIDKESNWIELARIKFPSDITFLCFQAYIFFFRIMLAYAKGTRDEQSEKEMEKTISVLETIEPETPGNHYKITMEDYRSIKELLMGW